MSAKNEIPVKELEKEIIEFLDQISSVPTLIK